MQGTRITIIHGWLAMSVLLALACDDASNPLDSTTDEDSASNCVPGDSKACECDNGEKGSRICANSGERWKACRCGSGGDSDSDSDSDADSDQDVDMDSDNGVDDKLDTQTDHDAETDDNDNSDTGENTNPDDTDADSDTDDALVAEPGYRADPKIPAASGQCPNFKTGTMTIAGLSGINVVAGTPKPGGPKAPMLIYWHGTGSSWRVEQFNVRAMQQEIVAQGGLVIAPDRSLGSGGDCSGTSTFSKGDMNVMDLIVACGVKNNNIDPRKIYTTGCSAGGLQAGCFASLRANYVAATVPNSGGIVFPQTIQKGTGYTPAVMTMYGPGARDQVVVQFQQTSKRLESQFKKAGAFVVSCNHGGGHCGAPAPLYQAGWDFMKAHPYGVEPFPYTDGLPKVYPDYCKIQ